MSPIRTDLGKTRRYLRALLPIGVSALVMASAGAAAGQTPAAGEEIAVATTSGQIVLVDVAGKQLMTLTTHLTTEISDWGPAWSPDGKWLAFARSTDGRRSAHVYVMRADGTGVRQITRGRFDERPAWSPDGRWIAYQTISGIRMVHPNGSGSRFVRGTGRAAAHYTEAYGAWPTWTPNRRLSYTYYGTGTRHGWVVTSDPGGGSRRPVLHGRDAHWSPDGRTIVFTPPDGGVAILSGGKRHFLGRGYLANWSPDGSRIVYARLGTSSAGDAIWIMDADGSNPHRILDGATDPAWSPATG